MMRRYNSSDARLLRERIRKNPARYIGSIDSLGLLTIAVRAWDFIFAESLAGDPGADTIAMTVGEDGSLAIEQDGSAISVEGDRSLFLPGRPASSPFEGLTIALGCGIDFERPPTGVLVQHIRYVSVMNFLSAWCVIETRWEGRRFAQFYERGLGGGRVVDLGPTNTTGTKISFAPDPEVFGDARFDATRLSQILAEWNEVFPEMRFLFLDATPGFSLSLSPVGR